MVTMKHDMNSASQDATITAHIWELLETVPDPEVPVLSVVDLGIIRDVQYSNDNGVTITVTPTYSGCPAIDMMKMQIRMALLQDGFKKIDIRQTLQPAWTTEWISEAGKEKLKAFGIAPPNRMQQVCTPEQFQEEEAVQCPLCHSYHTRLVSRFGSTACKALYQCNDCSEPFDYFKCH